MSFVKVWIHFVWSTKNREPLLTNSIRPKVFQHIRENAKTKEIHLDFIGGYTDHVHCLISLGSGQEIENIIRLIKGESSLWVNKIKLTRGKFGWQDEYFAVSVSPSLVPGVRRYIANQEEPHSTKSFSDEFNGFMKWAGFQRFEG
ncbi:MAG: IS200/IS605 family transposase [Pyrinomonadaceae bacterium]